MKKTGFGDEKKMKFKDLPNVRKKEILQNNYSVWKKEMLKTEGYFPVFQPFKEKRVLKDISGNALKLYIYLGLQSKNETGETWVTIETISNYFEKSPRTISNWIKELEKNELITRFQLEINGPAYTFLRPYAEYQNSEMPNKDNKTGDSK